MKKIAVHFARESVPSRKILEPFLESFSEIHYVIIKRGDNKHKGNISGSYVPNPNGKELLYKTITSHMDIGDILLVSEELKMIYNNDMLIYASNECGDKSNKFTSEFNNIYAATKKSPDLTFDFMLSDGFTESLIAYDQNKDCLYVYNKHDNSIAHAYVRGFGFFVHTDMQPLRDTIQAVCHVARDGMNLWENWYGHPLEGKTYREIDLDSGFMRIEHIDEK